MKRKAIKIEIGTEFFLVNERNNFKLTKHKIKFIDDVESYDYGKRFYITNLKDEFWSKKFKSCANPPIEDKLGSYRYFPYRNSINSYYIFSTEQDANEYILKNLIKRRISDVEEDTENLRRDFNESVQRLENLEKLEKEIKSKCVK